MNDERYVAAIEISSSKIMAVVGRTREAGHLDIIASEQEKGVECVRYGIIQNLEETSLKIARILERLQHKPAVAPRQIKGLFVGLSGRSLRNITIEADMALAPDTEITTDIIESLRERARSMVSANGLEILDIIPRTYRVGKTETNSPRGAVGDHISATYDIIVCRTEIKRNLERTIPDKLGIEIDGVVVTALSTAQLILSTEEKRLGCMLVDIGAETTTVSIYRDGHLCYFATLPLGGRNITRDLTTLNLLEEKAEEIKLTSGNAIARETPSTLNYNGVRMSDVSNLIVSRSEEIVANIIEQIKYAGLKENQLPGGIICIGGGSKLNGLLDLLALKSELPVKRGSLPPYIRVDEPRASSSEMIEVASVLYAGAGESDIESLEVPRKEELPATGTANKPQANTDKDRPTQPPKAAGSKIFRTLGKKISNFFAGEDDDDSDLLD